ncbi:hypothetical protein KKA17_07705 [bacterium]|nr:hypothetical protein [bacterium]MBU1883275.1 hypothetical protein [bacterium]
MPQNKIRVFLGLVGFLLLLMAILLALWKYAGVGQSVDQIVTTFKSKNLLKTPHSKLNIRIGYDSYLGYSILESKRFSRALENVKLSATLIDDNANYPERFAKLMEGKLDMAVMPIHDYLEQMHLTQPDDMSTPLIIAAISESRGSDAVVANPKKIPNIDALKKLKYIKAAYTSQFMLGSMAVDANIPILLKGRGIDANPDIEQTYNGLISGTYDVVGLWEPYITKAKEKGFIVLMGSDELQLGKIIDVVVVNRTFLTKHPEALEDFLQIYYESVSYFRDNMPALIEEIEIHQGGDLKKTDISASLEGIQFFGLSDNAYTLFRVHSTSLNKMFDYIDAVAAKLQKMGIISHNPMKNEDARNIVFPDLLRKVFARYPAGTITPPQKQEKLYMPIDNESWLKLIQDPKFTRDDLKITFLRDGRLDMEAKAVLDDFAQNSINNFDYYVAIVGRSGKARGLSEEQLVQRSAEKAQRVYEYLSKYWSIDKNRIHPLGLGSKGIHPPKQGENYYQYLNGHNRVELLFIAY